LASTSSAGTSCPLPAWSPGSRSSSMFNSQLELERTDAWNGSVRPLLNNACPFPHNRHTSERDQVTP
jgi:hypothetical protein